MSILEAIKEIRGYYEEKYGKDIAAEIMCKIVYCNNMLTAKDTDKIVSQILKAHNISEAT